MNMNLQFILRPGGGGVYDSNLGGFRWSILQYILRADATDWLAGICADQ